MNKKIKSIEIKNQSNGLYHCDAIISEAIKIYGDNKIRHCQYNGWSDKPVNVYEYEVKVEVIDKFFDRLIDEFKISDWEDDYSVDVCDGWTWEIKIDFIDLKVKKIVGTVELPPMGDRLKAEIFRLCDFDVKPWIL